MPNPQVEKEKTVKMFVWEDVLADYTSGIVCVLAKTLDEAYSIIRESDMYEWSKGEVLALKPTRVIEGSGIAWVHGGS